VSSYLVLARKYRPKQFSDMVGQQSVVRTLVNAIQMSRTHQAYVFSGSRGIGKTSIARIFSKALRCQNVKLEDGLLRSCDACSDCHEIAAGTSVDVLEIDGASNNGVDNVREIRENAKFLPSSGKYKIYIIDEVHMLSTAAFNALLKTLEEPPEHVVFIFATTESHKIPETILGRCQRFDFKRVTVAQIIGRTREVLAAEKIEAEEAALNLIARSAEGSMRDALSILDQVISFSGTRITASAVRESIGLIGTELVLELLKNIQNRDAKAALQIVQDAFTQGVDLKVLLKSAMELLHALILMQAGIEKPETHFTEDELSTLRTMIDIRKLEENELIFQVFHHGLDVLSRAAQPKLIFDLLVVKTSLAEALVRIEQPDAGNAQANPRRELRQGSPSSSLTQRAERAEMLETLAKTVQSTQGATKAESFPPVAAPAPEAAPALSSGLGFSFLGNSKSEPKEAASKPAASPGSGGPVTWERLIQICAGSKPMLAILLESVVETELPTTTGGTVRLGFREKDHSKMDQMNQKSMRGEFTQLVDSIFGFKTQLEMFVSKAEGESMAERNVRLQREARDQKMRDILGNPIVQEARSLFGADLTEIKMLEVDA